jgi:hypothetical protein
MTDFWCIPVCVGCKEIDSCAKTFDVPAEEIIQLRELWSPNRLEYCYLPCGCYGIPWPVVEMLGENIAWIDCTKHGSVKTTKNWKLKAKRAALKASRTYYRQLPMIPPY